MDYEEISWFWHEENKANQKTISNGATVFLLITQEIAIALRSS